MNAVNPRSFARLWPSKAAWARYFSTLRFALYVVFHPFDGFWDLTREKRGSMAAANTIVIALLLTRLARLRFTNFMFLVVHWEYLNLFEEWASILLPLGIWCVANWGFTTLFDGKGTLKDIYIATAYSLAPYLLLRIPMILLSNVVTYDERAFYVILEVVSQLWSIGLGVLAMQMIHDYTIGKTLLFTVMSVFGMLVIIFLMALFFSLISDGVGYFVTLYREITFRLY